MTTYLEQRKATALKQYPAPWENESMQDYDGRLGQWVGANEALIRELLQPAPADKEVDDKCGNCGGDGWYTWGHPEMPEQKQCEECCGQGIIPRAIGDTSLEYDGFRIIADPSVPNDMILCPDEKTQKTIHYRLHQNDELDKSCHDLGLEIIALKAQQPRQEWIADIDKLEKKTGLTVENALRKLALQERHADRQEWRTMESANTAIDNQLVIERDISDHAQLSDKDKHYTLGCISGLTLAKQLLKPLPSPPKEI